MNLNINPMESIQFIHERTIAPVFKSPHIAKFYGLFMSPKASFNIRLTQPAIYLVMLKWFHVLYYIIGNPDLAGH